MPNDAYDFDANAESVLADMRVNGEMRKVLINAHKNGFLYVLDRTNGKLIAAHPFVKVNWATHIDLVSGRPVLTDMLDASDQRRDGDREPVARDERDLDLASIRRPGSSTSTRGTRRAR